MANQSSNHGVFKTQLIVVNPKVFENAPRENATPLSEQFSPSNYDVICGRGAQCYNHIGNRRFRVTIGMNLQRYLSASSKIEKTLVVMSIVDTIRESSPEGGFVKQHPTTGRWFEVGDHLAREKVGQALRQLQRSKQPAPKQRRSNHEKSCSPSKTIAAPKIIDTVPSCGHQFLKDDLNPLSHKCIETQVDLGRYAPFLEKSFML